MQKGEECYGFYSSGDKNIEIRRKMLITQISKGNLDSFEKFYNENLMLVYGYLKLRINNDYEINDILQETFLAIWRNSGQYRDNSKVITWIIGIARNKMMDVLHKKYRKNENCLSTENIIEYAEEDFSDSLLEHMNVQNALQLLDDDSRELLYMVYNAGMSYKEIAKVLHIPEGTVKSRMYGIKNELKKKLV